MASPELSISKESPSKRKNLGAKETMSKTQKKGARDIAHKLTEENLNKSVKCGSHKRKWEMVEFKEEDNSPVMDRANEVLASLGTSYPSFIKPMVRSHVSGGFWLGLPRKFCDMHFPKHDDNVILEDEDGKEFITKYLAEKTGLSAGWRGFSIAHDLLAGDGLVFQLVKPSRMKVYIVRANGLAEVDGALGLLNLETCATISDSEKDGELHVKEEQMCFEPLSVRMAAQTIQKDGFTISNNDFEVIYTSENESEDLVSEVLDGIRLAESVPDFKEVKSIKNFNIHVNGLVINAEFSKHTFIKYYELCCCQNSFLHEHLLEGLNCKLVVGIISETVNIADAIRGSKVTASEENLVIWDKTLAAFETLGMKVGFLRSRLERLTDIAHRSQEAAQVKRYREALQKRIVIKEEVSTLEARLLEAKETTKRLDSEIEALKTSPQKLELMFKKEASASW